MPDARQIVLIGAMGSGKTTIGTRAAAALGRPFVDNDEALERSTGCTATELAARDGIEALHRIEADVVLAALARTQHSVIAAAASTITDPRVRDALSRRAWVVWLRADPATLVARLPESETRPFQDVDPADLVAAQARARDARFAAAADLIVDTGAARVDRVVAQLVASAHECGLGV